jgi:beta-lactam-binding protein with PASTA domain
MVVLAVTAPACGSDDDQSANPDPSTAASLSVDVPDIVGESVDEATATLADAGLTLRVLRRDGEDLPATMDLDESRINVAVETNDGTEVVTAVISNG